MPNAPHALWNPSKLFIDQTNLKHFQDWLFHNKGRSFENYDELWNWSVNEIEDFWESVWQYFQVINHSEGYDRVLSGAMPQANWFEGSLINYAEHIFRKTTTNRPAIIFQREEKEPCSIEWKELASQVAGFQAYLKSNGIEKGDRVVGYLPNIPESIVAFLAVNAIGAVWSCCSPDFGVSTVIDRFSQIAPKLLIAADGYFYNGKSHERLAEIKKIQDGLPSLNNTVLINYLTEKRESTSLTSIPWIEAINTPNGGLHFTPVPFNHPIWVLYSSGTTGKPKAITHSHGGVLLEHLKYMYFHNDVKEGENFFWFTTTGWMMWNFLQSSLLAGATAVLFDGSPGYPDLTALWQLAEKLPIHHFGTSAPFLTACMKAEMNLKSTHNLSQLRSIGSTGAPLPPEVFDWVYQNVSRDVWLCSMSGGTDVCTAFVGGIPYKSVIKGRIQGRALGCSLNALDDNQEKVIESLGEMVIDQPMPSMPVFFWNDPDFERYRSSYFEKFEGKWCHGDWINIFKDGSLIIQGRSDATLNRNGIRIGTAEIYSVLNQLEGIKDSLIVNIELEQGGDFMPLFVVLDSGFSLDDLSQSIKKNLRQECSPRHVPDKIIAVEDLPYTLSGKKMEVPVKKILMGISTNAGVNKESIRNPESLSFFEQLDLKDLLA